MKKILLIATLVFIAVRLSAQDDFLSPPRIDDGWGTGSALKAGLNTELLLELSNKIDSGHYKNIHSVLLIKDGKLLMEKYGGGFDRERIHSLRSISKFLTATLLGMAIDKGHIKSSDEPVFKYLPNYQDLKTEAKNKILLKHLVTMSAGLQWQESNVAYGTDENDETQMYRNGEWVRYTLSKPVISEPGINFEYSGGLANVTAAVLEEALPATGLDFAKKHLFAPLGISDIQWRTHKQHNWLNAAAGASLKPRDLAKIGQMYLNGGTWKGKRILSKEWVEQAGSAQVGGGQIGPFTLAYGYTALVIEKGPSFMPSLKGYAATGNGGQILWILPNENAVVVMTGGNYDNELSQTQPMDMMIRYIYPAMTQSGN
ncbi:MAG: serine hydrolase [Roseivirga sp.]|nr:serine hydrolase [Roseivirga sp.]